MCLKSVKLNKPRVPRCIVSHLAICAWSIIYIDIDHTSDSAHNASGLRFTCRLPYTYVYLIWEESGCGSAKFIDANGHQSNPVQSSPVQSSPVQYTIHNPQSLRFYTTPVQQLLNMHFFCGIIMARLIIKETAIIQQRTYIWRNSENDIRKLTN